MTFRWYVCGLAVAAAVGWLAARCHLAGLAPVGIVSLAVGVALGLGLAKLAGHCGITCRRQLWQLYAGAFVFALAAIFAQHAWLYHDFRRQWHEVRARNPQVAIFRPETPWTPLEYLRFEATGPRVTLWCVDAALILAGTMGVVMLRRPIHKSAVTSSESVSGDANLN